MGEISKRHLETADRTKLRFLRTGVRRRGSEPMAHHGDFRLDPKAMTFEIGHPWGYLTTNVVLFLYLTSNWKMTGSCIISYIHGYLGLTCQALWENDPVLIWGWVKTNYYAHILGGITIHYPAISGYGPRGWLGY